MRTPLLDALEQAATAYEQWLADAQRGRATREYLAGRGIAPETIRAFRLGLAPEGWDNLSTRLASRLGEDVLVQAGLAMRREGKSGVYDRFRERLMVPLISGGTVIGFGARALGDQQPKYLNSPETPVYHKGSFLFALDVARRAAETAGEVVVVEGYFDTIALHQAGIAHTVATSGTALTADQARLLRRAAPRVALTYDGDEAGQEAMMRSLAVLLAEGLEVLVVDLPAGEDPDTVVRNGGVEAWRALRAQAADPVEFIQRHLLRAGSAAGDPRERALQAVVRLTVEVKDPIRARLLIERASQVFGLSEAVLGRAVGLQRRGENAAPPVAAAVREQKRGEGDLERAILKALLQAPEALAEIRELVTPEDFRDPAAASLARWLWSGQIAFPDDGPEGGAAGTLARDLTALAPAGFDWPAEVRGAARRMVERRLKEQLREHRNRLGRTAEADESARLMQEIDTIARSLRELSTQS
jgi:DNA primase